VINTPGIILGIVFMPSHLLKNSTPNFLRKILKSRKKIVPPPGRIRYSMSKIVSPQEATEKFYAFARADNTCPCTLVRCCYLVGRASKSSIS
jgi:hypothetical protein